MTKVNNPRFPHWCKIYKYEGETSFDEGKEVVLYEGECRKYGNTSIRTFTSNSGIQKADYALSIPGQVCNITTGIFADVRDLTGEIKGAFITDSYPTNLGTTVYFNLPKN